MKKILYILTSVLCAVALVSCEKENYGTTPGTDSTPYVVFSTFSPSLPYDADTDVLARFAANSNTADLYYLAELTATKEQRNLAPEAYADYVIQNGTKLSTTESVFDGSRGVDAYITGLKGDNTITAVAVNAAGEKYSTSTTFFGINWVTVSTGTYEFGNTWISNYVGSTSVSGIELQQRADSPNYYRFKNLYGTAHHLNIVLYPEYTATDDDGTYTFFRVPAQATGLSHKSYGAINVRDVGYWQGDEDYVFAYGYESGMYKDYSCFLMIQTYVSAGNCGYKYDYFIPE